MGPMIFAIFVFCSPNLLYCEYKDALTKNFFKDWRGCREYVQLIESANNNRDVSIMGKCVWRITDD